MPTTPAKPSIEERQGAVYVRIRVQPKASRNTIQVEQGGCIRITLTAPPVEGAANKALCAFLAQKLRVARTAVTLRAGAKSRDKTVAVRGVSYQEVRERLS